MGQSHGDPYEDGWAYKLEDGTWLEGGEDCDVESPRSLIFWVPLTKFISSFLILGTVKKIIRQNQLNY